MSFAPPPTPEEREHNLKFGGYDRGIWSPARSCSSTPLIPWICPTPYARHFKMIHECREHLGHRDSGTPHKCKCGRMWMDRELRRVRRQRRKQRRAKWPSFWQRVIKIEQDARRDR